MPVPEALPLPGFRDGRSARSPDRFSLRSPEEVSGHRPNAGHVDCINGKPIGTNMKQETHKIQEEIITIGTIRNISSQNVDICHECGTMRQGPGNSCRLPVPGPNRALGVGTPATGNRAGAGGVRCCRSMCAAAGRSSAVRPSCDASVRPWSIDREPWRRPKTNPNRVLPCMVS